MIDSTGRPYSWGKGYIGMGNEVTKVNMPAMIETNTDNRIFTDIFANEDSVVFYAPIRVYGVEPRCGPASGGTLIKIVGTGFANSDRLRVRFTYGDLSQEVSCQYNDEDKSLFCKTPKFEEFEGQQHPSLKLPCNCIISVTMDGIHYSECEAIFKIYSNEIYLTSINPKCGGIQGGTSLTLLINIDDVTAQSIQNLRIGFQPKKGSMNPDNSKNSIENGQNSHRLDGQKSFQSLHESQKSSVKGSRSILQAYGAQDPLIQTQYDDLTQEDPMAGWTWTDAKFDNGTIMCVVPAIDFGKMNGADQEGGAMQYNVDVALNG
jgi:hypothetical protein